MFQLKNPIPSQAVTQTQYSSSCISRSDLKFRLKNQKISQKRVFRNTLKDLSKYADPKSPVAGTETDESKLHLANSLNGLDYQNLLKSSVTNPLITPLMGTNRGSRREDLAGKLYNRKYLCYSQLNESNMVCNLESEKVLHENYARPMPHNFDLNQFDYSDSGFSVNLKSNRGFSE